MLGAGVVYAISATRSFSLERHVFYREAAAGMNSYAYFFAKMLKELLTNAWIHPLIFSITYYLIATPKQDFGNYFYVYFGISFVCSGIGHFFAISMALDLITMAAGIFPLICGSYLNGINPKFNQS